MVTTTYTPTTAAMRAAYSIGDAEIESDKQTSLHAMAEIIDQQTGLADLLYELGGIADALAHGGTVTIDPGSVKHKRIVDALAKVEKGGAA